MRRKRGGGGGKGPGEEKSRGGRGEEVRVGGRGGKEGMRKGREEKCKGGE